MSDSHFNCLKSKNSKSSDYGGFETNSPVESVDNEDYEYLQEVPYSSSSVDRSSIGSIPWAEDAIKQNQRDWERVERMISGEEPLPDEPELRNEIIDWQRKFPELLGKKPKFCMQPSLEKEQLKSFDSNRTIDDIADDTLDIEETLSIFSENSLDNEDIDKFDEEIETPKQQQPITSTLTQATSRFFRSAPKRRTEDNNIAQQLDRNLHITSYPLQKRVNSSSKPFFNTYQQQNQGRISIIGVNHSIPHTPTAISHQSFRQPLQYPFNTRVKMPPIINVLEKNQRYREDSRSFVQLTQVHQAKSAVESHNSSTRQRSAAWQTQLPTTPTSSRHLRFNHINTNNRNSIILPAINMQYQNIGRIVSSRSQTGLTNKTKDTHHQVNNSGFSSTANSALQNRFGFDPRQFTKSNSSSTGRSISAAAHRTGISNYYLPNSASKYNVFK